MMIKAPVLLITFNRPHYTQDVFNSIRSAKPNTLYVFNDGPRKGNINDDTAREEIKRIIKQIDWDCKLYQNFFESNLGCGIGPVTAINWAFQNEDRIIILEDDTIPSRSFYDFCDLLLDKYYDDDRIFMISGNNNLMSFNNSDDSYFFSKYGFIPGWATWKRAWNKYDYNMSDWLDYKKSDQIKKIFNNKTEQNYFLTYFDSVFKRIDSSTWWDHQWFYCRLKNRGLTIVPKVNLIKNIGIVGTHSSEKSKIHNTDISNDFIIKVEPQVVNCNDYYDDNLFNMRIRIKTSIIKRALRKIRRLIKL